MAQPSNEQDRQHVPDNADYEIRKAWVAVIEAEITYSWNQNDIEGINLGEAASVYTYAYEARQKGNRLAAERWARAAKHLARALKQEVKLAYLASHFGKFPTLNTTVVEKSTITEKKEMTIDLINCVDQGIRIKFDPIPKNLKRYLDRANRHIAAIQADDQSHSFSLSERVNAAYEYGRVLECMLLAYEAEPNVKVAA